jgi:NAD(P)-dependent dehydrogenase (short-subunit alcohol dehydrogenase family)
VVTGASGGVVAGIARRVMEAGAAVVVHYRSDADGAAAVVDAIGAAGSRQSRQVRSSSIGQPSRPGFRRYGIGSPMLDDCCRATRPPAGPRLGNVPRVW